MFCWTDPSSLINTLFNCLILIKKGQLIHQRGEKNKIKLKKQQLKMRQCCNVANNQIFLTIDMFFYFHLFFREELAMRLDLTEARVQVSAFRFCFGVFLSCLFCCLFYHTELFLMIFFTMKLVYETKQNKQTSKQKQTCVGNHATQQLTLHSYLYSEQFINISVF